MPTRRLKSTTKKRQSARPNGNKNSASVANNANATTLAETKIITIDAKEAETGPEAVPETSKATRTSTKTMVTRAIVSSNSEETITRKIAIITSRCSRRMK